MIASSTECYCAINRLSVAAKVRTVQDDLVPETKASELVVKLVSGVLCLCCHSLTSKTSPVANNALRLAGQELPSTM